jgi:hypothetical protein
MRGLHAGTRVTTVDFPKAVWAADTTAQTNISNTEFAPGSPVVAVHITAPTSGRVRVDVSGVIRDNGGDNRGLIAYEVYDLDGTLIVSASPRGNSMSSMNEASDYMTHSRGSLVEGLTPGEMYYVRLVQAVSGGSSVDILARSLIVYPVP